MLVCLISSKCNSEFPEQGSGLLGKEIVEAGGHREDLGERDWERGRQKVLRESWDTRTRRYPTAALRVPLSNNLMHTMHRSPWLFFLS